MNNGGSQNSSPGNTDQHPLSSTNLDESSDLTSDDPVQPAGTNHNDNTLLDPPATPGLNQPCDMIFGPEPSEKYNLLREIARGGMGVVLEAQDLNLTRNIAMKVILDPATASRQRVLRFIEEARITSRLQHPGIMPIHELGVDKNGNVFYTMKHVTGKTLNGILTELKNGNSQTEKEYPLNRLLAILLRVCDAVAYAHSKGVIHRDLKPENIMIGEYGEVLVLDWGLAKCFAERRNMTLRKTGAQQQVEGRVAEHINALANVPAADPIRATPPDLRPLSPPPDLRPPSSDLSLPDLSLPDLLLTMEGNAIGTPGYMAPEQARGQVARMDEKSDIYSLGAILFHILTLEPTIKRSRSTNRQELLATISAGKIETPKESTRAPAALIAIAMKALSLRPKDRYPTVNRFQADIEAYLGGFATSTEQNSLTKLILLFVLRHKVVSFFSTLILVLTVIALSVNYSERMKALAAYKMAALEGRRAADALSNLKATAPALISLADYHLEKQEIQKALEVVDRATALVADSPECHRKRGDILQVLQRFKEAAAEYEKVLALAPADQQAAANLALTRQLIQKMDIRMLSAALWEQERFSEACYVMLPSMREQKPEMVKRLLQWILAREKILHRSLLVDDAECRLDLSKCNIADLSPLKVMPLTHLNLTDCTGVYDLRPLKGLPLRELILSGCSGITDLSPLKGMSLQVLDLQYCTRITDLSPLNNMPLTSLNIAGSAKIQDLSLLKGMPLLTLDISGNGVITDLRPLKGMRLISLNLRDCPMITDFSPLKDMPIARFMGGESHPSRSPTARSATTLPLSQ